MKVHQVFLLSLAILCSAETEPKEDGFELRQLTDDNFKGSTSRGLWLVEHFSPRCGHCRAFAPTWELLAKDHQHLERLSGFHMAQVNCLAQGDLCNTNNIKFYPSLILYSDGKETAQYTGDRSYEDLSTWIDDHSTTYAQNLLVERESQDDNQAIFSSTVGRPNPEGNVLAVDEVGLEGMISSGAVLVDFFAPWCGHCKKLKPIYETVAQDLKIQLNVVTIDCDAHNSLCRRQGIKGYPTIRLYHKGQTKNFAGSRNVEGIKEFAMQAVGKPTLQTIKLIDFTEIVKKDEAFFLYIQNFETKAADTESVKIALEPLLNSIPAYTSSDPDLYKYLALPRHIPDSILLAFSSPSSEPIATLSFPTPFSSVEKFIQQYKFPALVEITKNNFIDIFRDKRVRPLVVLGALHDGEKGLTERDELGKIAMNWKSGISKEESGLDVDRPVWFGWLEGKEWEKWMKSSYGIKKNKLPAVVVIDPAVSEYYDKTSQGTKISIDEISISSVLSGVLAHTLKPKKSETTFEWTTRGFTSLGRASVNHPFLAIIGVVASFGVFYYWSEKKRAKRRRSSVPLNLRLD